jgi:phenylacetate-CoA ligase
MTPIHERYLATLRQTQWMPADRLAEHHNDLLEKIARHAHENVPVYRERLAPLFGGGEFHIDRWGEIPIAKRDEIQSQPDIYRAERTPENLKDHLDGFTSGTVGTRLNFIQSSLAAIASQCQFERMLEVHGIDRSAHLARIRGAAPDSATNSANEPGRGWNLLHPTAPLSRIDIGASIAAQADELLRLAPNYLQTYPSTAAALAQHIRSGPSQLALWGVLTIGEIVTAETRDEVRNAFGCSVIDSYGATELGYLAFQCPAGEGYHIAHESCRLEIVGDDGKAAPSGAAGRVVVTSLYNYAMPFIRYDLGDFAVAADGPCRCGRTLPRLAQIIGRSRSIFVFPDGSQHSPSLWRGAFRDLISARQVQIVQTAVDQIELRFIPNGGPEPDQELIERRGKAVIHPDVIVRAVAVDDVSRSPSGKIEDCVSLISAR